MPFAGRSGVRERRSPGRCWSRSPAERRSEQGSILVLAIGMLAIFTVLSIGLSRIAGGRIHLVRWLQEQMVSRYLAEAAVRDARWDRHRDQTPYDTLHELRTARRREVGQVGAFVYTMVDEESRIPLNTAPQRVLARVPGFTLDLAVVITNSPQRPFPVKEVMRQLEEITDDVWEQAHEWLTVYGNGTVNLNTASPPVLAALGMDERLVAVIREYRAGPDGVEGTEDDGVFKSPAEMLQDLRQVTVLSADQEATVQALLNQGLLGVAATQYTLRVQTYLVGRPALRYAIVVDRRRWQVTQWSVE